MAGRIAGVLLQDFEGEMKKNPVQRISKEILSTPFVQGSQRTA